MGPVSCSRPTARRMSRTASSGFIGDGGLAKATSHRIALAERRDEDGWEVSDCLVEGAIILKVKGKSYRAPKTKGSEDNPAEK